MTAPKKCGVIIWMALLPLMCCFVSAAQVRGTSTPMQDSLREVSIRASRLKGTAGTALERFTPGSKSVLLDSGAHFQTLSLARVLEEESPVFVRAYGFNSLATLSIRGSSAAQSLVLWNGISINNGALGAADLSLIPSAFAGQATLVYGSSSALLGSGNVGGALLLDDAPPHFDTSGFSGGLTLTAGSYGLRQAIAHTGWSGRQARVSLVYQGSIAENNFTYRLQSGTVARMPNAAQNSHQLLASADFSAGGATLLSLRIWLQESERGIPPALFESFSGKTQTDAAARLLLLIRQVVSRSVTLVARGAYTRDFLGYSDHAIGLKTTSTVHRLVLHQEYEWRRGRHSVLLAFPVQYAFLAGSGADTAKKKGIAQLAASLNYLYTAGSFSGGINGRAEKNGAWQSILPGAGATFKVAEWLSIRSGIQRTFRAPTLNELYFSPGGNKDLVPEAGWAGDAGFSAQWRKGRFSVSQQADVFSRYIHNWIIWYGGAVFTPHNIAAVYSRGIETGSMLRYASRKWTAEASFQSAYVRSTTEESKAPNDASIGRQIPYVPRYAYRAAIRLFYGRWSLSCHHASNSYRFITTDESQYLLPYATTTLAAGWERLLGKSRYGLSLSVFNLCDQRYEGVAGRPLPGRNGQATLRWQWR